MIDIMLFLTMPSDLDVSCLSNEFPAKVSQGAFISLDKKRRVILTQSQGIITKSLCFLQTDKGTLELYIVFSFLHICIHLVFLMVYTYV